VFLTDDVLQQPGNQADISEVWRLSRRQPVIIAVAVVEHWLVNVRMHPRRFREMVPATWLDPHLIGGSLVLTLSALRVGHAAPLWAPLELGPASLNAEVRMACRDRRDGRLCAWIAASYSDNVGASPVGQLTSGAVSGGLRDHSVPGRLDLSAEDGLVQAQARPGQGVAPELFADAAAFAGFLVAGARCYRADALSGHCQGNDETGLTGKALRLCPGWEGWLRTPWGDCTIDGVYCASEGLYRWTSLEEVDERGERL